MDIRRVMSIAMILGVAAAVPGQGSTSVVWAADRDYGTVEAAEMGAEQITPQPGSDVAHDQIMQRVELLRQVDPALAEKMENQVKAIESGMPQHQLLPEQGQLDLGAPIGDAPMEEALDETALRQRAEEQMMRDVRLQRLFSDSRLQELRQQVQAGQLSEEQGRERLADILREYGLGPPAGAVDHGLTYDNISGGGMQEEVGPGLGAYDPFDQAPEAADSQAK